MKSTKYLILIILCFNLACKKNTAQSDQQGEIQIESSNDEKLSILTTIPKEKYIEDLDQLMTELKNHPQLYEHIRKDELRTLVEENKGLITEEFKIGEFTWLCRAIVSRIGCCHTVVPTLGMNYFLADALLFPLEVNFINNKLYVLNPLSNNQQISVGDEILKINGQEVKNIFIEMSKHISADANNMSFKSEYINDSFMEYAAFHFKFVNSYEIELKQKDEAKTVSLYQLSSYSPDEAFTQGKCENNLCFEIDKKNDLAIITIRSFYYYRENFEATFKPFIDSCFSEIKSNQLQNLLIDLRDNGGGAPHCASYLLEHIADKPFQYFKNGTHEYPDLQRSISPNKNRFHGKPAIFINGRCFSTTGQLCALIKENDFGIFIGKETGATYTCNSTSQPSELKNTGVTAYIATRTFEANVFTLPNDKGITPHHRPKYDILDVLDKKDVDLEFYLNMISNK